MSNKVEVKIGGLVYDGWKGAKIRRSIEEISSVFSFDFIDAFTPRGRAWGVNTQDDVSVTLGRTTIITGYVDLIRGRLSDAERVYSAQGRDRTADLVDCSASVRQFKNISLLELCNEIGAPGGVPFRLSNDSINNVPFKNFVINPSETMFEAIDRAVRQRGVLPVPDGNGGVLLTLAGEVSALTSLVEGQNCKAVSYSLDYSKRFSQYVIKGQDTSPQGWSPSQTAARGEAFDYGVKRRRYLETHAENTATAADCKVRAAWEANVRAARSTQIVVEVQGFFQSPGLPWLINQKVQFEADRLGLGISGTFLISETEYSQDETSGSITTMTLVPPDAFLSDPTVKKKKSDQVAKGWST